MIASGSPDDIIAFTNSVAQAYGGLTGVGVNIFQTDGATKFLPSGTVAQTSVLTPSADNTLTCMEFYIGTKVTETAGTFCTVW